HCANTFVAKRSGAFAAVFVSAQEAENSCRIRLFTLGGNLRENFLNRAELLGFIVNDEIALVAEFLDVLAEDPDAKGVEGANRRALRFRFLRVALRAAWFWNELFDALLHFAGGFVG